MKKFLQLFVAFGLLAMPGFAADRNAEMDRNAPVQDTSAEQPMDANYSDQQHGRMIYDNGDGQCPSDQAVSGPECNCTCWQKFVHYKPCYYTTRRCCERQVPYTVRCCKMCPKTYTVQKCRYVPQYYCETHCCQVPEYYNVQRCRPEHYYVCDKHCKYEPSYYYKKVCPENAAEQAASSCEQGCCAQ